MRFFLLTGMGRNKAPRHGFEPGTGVEQINRERGTGTETLTLTPTGTEPTLPSPLPAPTNPRACFFFKIFSLFFLTLKFLLKFYFKFKNMLNENSNFIF